MDDYPRISVVIPTCNRPDDVQRALDSLTAVEYCDWEVLVVDQSDDERTQAIVETVGYAMPNLRYRRLREKGCSFGRNVGIAETEGEIVGFLDDDCTVRPDWLTQAAGAFGRYPRAAIVLGELRRFDGLKEWSADGWIPVRHFPVEFEACVVDNRRQRFRIWTHLMGNGACMFMRRSSVQHIGLFDLQMGGGGHFPACEDGDFIYRALMAGCRIVGTPAIVADHHGLRDHASGAAARLLRAYEYSIGAWFMKVLRLGDPCALYWILIEYRHALASIHLQNILFLHGPTGLLSTVSFTRGLVESFGLRVDRRSKLFMPRTVE